MTLEPGIVEILASKYLEIYPQREAAEIEVGPIRFGDFTFTGFIDGLHDPLTLIEDKLKSQWSDNDIDTLQHDDQVMGYVYAYWMKTGCNPEDVVVKYRVTRKPLLRQKKGETDTVFLQRIKTDVDAHPEKYFKEYELSFTKEQIDDWVNNHAMVAKMISICVENDMWPKNTSACIQFFSKCEMYELCHAKSDEEAMSALDNYEIKEVHGRSSTVDNVEEESEHRPQ